jgi:hypothetical protein
VQVAPTRRTHRQLSRALSLARKVQTRRRQNRQRKRRQKLLNRKKSRAKRLKRYKKIVLEALLPQQERGKCCSPLSCHGAAFIVSLIQTLTITVIFILGYR